MPNELRGELAYKVRPLNGIWATPPYLHNGSVPTIEALLGAARRQAEEILSRQPRIRSREPRLQVRPDRQRFRIRHLDSRQLEQGHEFRKEYSKDKEIKGVIGPALSADDRKALIEYLKTL